MNTAKWNTPAAIATLLTSDLNSLANGALSTPTEAGATFDNAANLELYANFELVLASLTPTGAPSCSLYFFPALDGTNYGSPLITSTQCIVCVFPLDTAASAKRVPATNVLLPPFKGRFALLNNAGVALASSGNTLKIVTADVNLNG